MKKNSIPCLRKEFMDAVGNHGGLPLLFSNRDEVAFFLKNHRFEIVFANQSFYGRFGFSSESEIVGKDDFELFPQALAEKFRIDDEQTLRTGKPMPKLIELFLNRQGLPDWYVTYKVPVLTRSAEAVGIMGTVERYRHLESYPATHNSVSLAIKTMRSDPGSVSSLQGFIEGKNISYRHFDRLFKEATSLTPKQYLGRSRVQKACELLRESEQPIADIATELGYCDQSALTSQFRKRMGFTPLQYRKKYSSTRKDVS